VRCGSIASKGIIFYLLIGMFLIALVEKLMLEIQLVVAVFSCQKIILKMLWHQLFRWSNDLGVSGK